MTATEPLLTSQSDSSSAGQANYGSNSESEAPSSTFSSLITTKTIMKTSFLSSFKDAQNKLGVGPKKKTLLEKAKAYRAQNPEVWARKCQEKEKKDRERNEIFLPNPFLESYYEEIDELEKEKEKKKQLEKLEPPKLILRLIFNLPRKKSEKDAEQIEPYESFSSYHCIFERDDSIFDVFKSDKNEERGSEPEFIITAKQTIYLQHNLKEGQKKYSSSRLKCCLYDDNGKRKEKELTDYIYVSMDGKASWSYSYILKGYNQEDLKKHHVTFKVTAKSEDDTHVIGEAIIAGENATIQEDGAVRSPTSTEYNYWQRSIENPGEIVNVALNLLNKDSAEKRASTKSNSDHDSKSPDPESKSVDEKEKSLHQDNEKEEKAFRKSESPKKSSGLKRILPRFKSHEGLSNRQDSSKSLGKKLAINKIEKSKEISNSKLMASESMPNVTNLMSKMMSNSTEVKVTAAESNKLPPSSNMKVTKTTPEDLSVMSDKLPPISKMKVTRKKTKDFKTEATDSDIH